MNGLDLSQFKSLIVRPVITALALPGSVEARTQLHTGIPLAESALVYLAQLRGGPALGVSQVEKFTHDDCWLNYLQSRPALARVVRGYVPARFIGQSVPDATAMIESLSYSVAISVIRFARSPVALPAQGDARAQCQAWKDGYNTPGGAGVVDVGHISLFQRAIDA
ncbi:MAG: hypothetical protein ABF968_04760 [Acetobacter sp.]|uniref:hypothetical protein n=1 Tax=Acetobacter sp. TaxID=440 RepID=UPI0039EB735D